MTLYLRASGMPLAFLCPASVRSPGIRIREECEPASMGSAFHEAARDIVETGYPKWDELPIVAASYGVEEEELRMLIGMASKLWPTIRCSFPRALTEMPLDMDLPGDTTLTGHVDFASLQCGVARAGDWKTGRKDADYSHQMKAYAALLLASDKSLKEATVTLVWLREGDIENYTMTRDGMADWVSKVERRIINWDGVYYTGAHCEYCSRNHECDASHAMVKRDVSAIAGVDVEAIGKLPPNELLSLYQKAGMIQRVSKRVHDAIKAHVEAHGDVVANDTRLTIQVEPRMKLSTIEAWPVLEEVGLDNADLAECVSISVSKAESAVAKKADRGHGAAAVREFADKLAKAGALKTHEIRKLTTKRG